VGSRDEPEDVFTSAVLPIRRTGPNQFVFNIALAFLACTDAILAVRANQRDLYHVSSLQEQVETVLRPWFGQ
jgi:hypothetical protein